MSNDFKKITKYEIPLCLLLDLNHILMSKKDMKRTVRSSVENIMHENLTEIDMVDELSISVDVLQFFRFFVQEISYWNHPKI